MAMSDDASASMMPPSTTTSSSPPSSSRSPTSSSSSSPALSPATRDFFAGLGAGVASVVVGQPLDTLRVNEQAVAASTSARCSASSSSSSRPPPSTSSASRGPLATARRLLASSGPSAFWRGVSYPAATIGFQSAIVFQAYGAACRFLAEREGKKNNDDDDERTISTTTTTTTAATAAATAEKKPLSYSSVFLAGTASGAAQLAVIVPVDLLKIRAQLAPAGSPSPCPISSSPSTTSAASPSASSPSAASRLRSLASPLTRAVSSAWRDGGRSVRGLYRGGIVTAARDVPSHGVYFAAYELCRELFDPGSRSRSLRNGNGNGGEGGDGGGDNGNGNGNSSLALFAAGGVAGAASWLSVYPLDVLKTRVQAATLSQTGTGTRIEAPSPASSSSAVALREAWAAGGLWRGLSSTLARAFVVNSVLFYAYESLIEAMGGRDPSDAPEESAAAPAAVSSGASSSSSSSFDAAVVATVAAAQSSSSSTSTSSLQ